MIGWVGSMMALGGLVGCDDTVFQTQDAVPVDYTPYGGE